MITETIRRVNGYEKDAYTYYPVIIVGAGASGIAMACQLKQQLGFDQFPYSIVKQALEELGG